MDRLGQSGFIDVIDLTPSIQKGVNWDKVAASGVKGVLIQCSRYSSTPELAYDAYAEAASKAGLVVGAYHFAACDSDPVSQAEFFLRRLHSYGLRPGDIPPVMDLEYAKKTMAEKGSKYIVQWGEKFMARVLQEMQKLHLKSLPGWYTYPNFGSSLVPHIEGSELSATGRYWFHLARYRGNKAPEARWYPRDDQRPDLVPKGCPEPILWQYSGNGGYPVPGVPGDCDRNVFIGSSGDWQDFLGLDRPVHQTDYCVK